MNIRLNGKPDLLKQLLCPKIRSVGRSVPGEDRLASCRVDNLEGRWLFAKGNQLRASSTPQMRPSGKLWVMLHTGADQRYPEHQPSVLPGPKDAEHWARVAAFRILDH